MVLLGWNVCSFLWYFAILYGVIYICIMAVVVKLNRCRFNRTNKGVLITYSLIFSLTVAGSTLNIFKAEES